MMHIDKTFTEYFVQINVKKNNLQNIMTNNEQDFTMDIWMDEKN